MIKFPGTVICHSCMPTSGTSLALHGLIVGKALPLAQKAVLLAASLILLAGTVSPLLGFSITDQYMLELINWSRANPQDAADTYLDGDLNEGLSPGTITATPKQP